MSFETEGGERREVGGVKGADRESDSGGALPVGSEGGRLGEVNGEVFWTYVELRSTGETQVGCSGVAPRTAGMKGGEDEVGGAGGEG